MDARWVKKGEETHYGYKNHVLSDRKSKLITEYVVTDAAVHDSMALDDLLAGDSDGQQLSAASAYRSAAIETQLAAHQIKSQMHERGYRERPPF